MTVFPLNPPRVRTDSRRREEYGFGPVLLESGVRFRIWAPLSKAMSLLIKDEEKPWPMRKIGDWYELDVSSAAAGTLYKFLAPSGKAYPDPGSRFQPYGAGEWSEVVDAADFAWTDRDWRGRPWHETVLYELHVGTFTPQSTYRAGIEKLDHLAQLGVTAIELMPVADFVGRWNWGYDGIHPYAPHAGYGRPDDLRSFVDAAHQRNLMVVLDVVYNHLGPEAKDLADYSRITSSRHATEWGPSFNLDGAGAAAARRYVVENALYWIRDFHMDGLRLDAIHTIADDSPRHLLEELTDAVQQAAGARHLHLIAENTANQPVWLQRRETGEPRYFVAQWNDELHHALHAVGTGETEGVSSDFTGRPQLLGRALAEGYAYQGEMLPSSGEPKGAPSAFLPPTAFVSFIQNHDQIGNRPFGERITSLAPERALRALAAIYLVAPQVPMLFMGEEWGTMRPFLYFSDREPHPPGAPAQPRNASKDAPPVADWTAVPHPADAGTLLQSQLDWGETEAAGHREWLRLYTSLLDLRHREIVPRLRGIGGHCGTYRVLGSGALDVRWKLADDCQLVLLANLHDEPFRVGDPLQGRTLWVEGQVEGSTLQPWSLVWNLVGPPH